MTFTRRQFVGRTAGLAAAMVAATGSAAPRAGRDLIAPRDRTTPLFGAAVTPYPGSGRSHTEEVLAHESDCGPMAILRTYDGGTPIDWHNPSAASGSRAPTVPGWESRASWHSVKPPAAAVARGELDCWIAAYVESIPVTGFPRLLTMWHEPEGKVPNLFSAATWKRAAHRFGTVVADVGHPDVLYGPCFMSHWALTNGRAPVPEILTADPVDLFGVCDFVGWDPYHLGSWHDRYDPEYTPGYYIDPLIEFTAQHTDAPIAIGETGFKPKIDDLGLRANWLRALTDYVPAHNIIACCYFDAGVRDYWMLLRTVGETGLRDEESIAAWAEAYRR